MSNERNERIVVTAKGGGNEVGASHYHYLFNDELVAVDCGLRPSNFNSDIRPVKIWDRDLADFLDDMLVKPAIDPLPNLDSPEEIKHLFLTHGHLDHVGAVPYLLRKHRYANIYATPVTAAICKIQWFSTPRIAERNKEIPLFNESDAEFALSRIVEIRPGQRIKINDKLEVEPVGAGHLLGAVSFVFYLNGIPVGFHTGDLTLRNNQRTVPDAPRIEFDRLRFLTIDSTRLTEQNPPRHIEEDRFKELVRESYDKGMKIRIPTFAIGRLQEMFILCKEACPGADIWIDGQGREVSAIFAKHIGSDLSGSDLSGVEKHFINDKGHRSEVIKSDKPNIVLSPSAMQFGGFSRQYVEYGCGQPDHLFISPGYRDSRSPEYAFFASTSRHNDVFAFGAYKATRMCQTATFNFTAHCDGEDVLDTVDRTNPENILLVHGNKNKMGQFVESHPNRRFAVLENNKPLVV